MLLEGDASSVPGSMEENLSNLLHSLFDIFRNLADVGRTWGEPWGWLFPTLVALATALAFVAGIRYVFDQTQGPLRKIFLGAALLVGALAFVAVFDDGRVDTASDDPPAAADG